MVSEDARLRFECLLRRAGLAGVPAPVLACLGVMMTLLVVMAVWQFWPAGPVQDGYEYQAAAQSGAQDGEVPAEQAGDSADGAGAQAGATQGGTGEAALLSVDVEGAVASPGLYTLPDGARVGDAVERAGGMAKSAAKGAVNLAEKLQDGMQVYVPEKGEAGQAEQGAARGAAASKQGSSAGSATSAAGDDALVNLNSASLEELQALPGVGPVLAQSIVAYREQNGPFASPEDVKNVSGIGDTRYDRIKDAICV